MDENKSKLKPSHNFHQASSGGFLLTAPRLDRIDAETILGIPIETVNSLISGKRPLTPQTAQGLGAVFGTGREYWLNLEKVKDGSF